MTLWRPFYQDGKEGRVGKKIDLTGEVFGKWQVMHDSGKRGTSGCVLWTCKCECGQKHLVQSPSLIQGRSKGCSRCSRMAISNTYLKSKNGEVIIKCTNGNLFKISEEDLETVRQYQWWVDTKGYVKTKVRNRGVLLSRLLLGVDDDGRSVFVDHISGDTLDNRRSNLRVCTQEQNARNRRLNSNNKTGFKGVSLNSKLKKFRADIRAGNGKTIYLGMYKTAEEAADAYDMAASFYHGNFARTNKNIHYGG